MIWKEIFIINPKYNTSDIMFANPDEIIKSYEKYSYHELLKVRDDLVEDMRNFENDNFPHDLWDSTAKPDEAYRITAEILSGVLKLMMDKFCENDYPPSYRGIENNPNSFVIKRVDDEGKLLDIEKYMEQFENASGDIIEQEINELLDLILKCEDKFSKIDDMENSKEYEEYLQYQKYLTALENLFYEYMY